MTHVDLRSLLQRVEQAKRPDRYLDYELHRLVNPKTIGTYAGQDFATDSDGIIKSAAFYTRSLDAATQLVSQLLPDWWWSCGYCQLSNDASLVPRASMAPDFRASPEAHALVNKHPKFDEGFHCDLRYGNVPIALLTCLLMALIAKAEVEEGMTEL